MKLYHKTQKSFPNKVREQAVETFTPIYTKHAIDQAKKRNLKLPETITYNGNDVFEVELGENNEVIKYGIRVTYNPKKDIIVIFKNNHIVKTVWWNQKNDQHKTLDMTKYTPE